MVLFVLTLVFANLSSSSSTFFSGDCGIKFLQARSVLAHGAFDPWIPYPGHDLDPTFAYRCDFLQNHGDRLYSIFPPLFPTVTALFFGAFGKPGLFVVPAATAALILILSAGLCRLLTGGTGGWQLAAVASVLATPVLFYGSELWEHTPATMAGLLAVLLTERHLRTGSRSGRTALLTGLALGTAGALRLEALFLAPALALATFFPRTLPWARWLRYWATAAVSCLAVIVASLYWNSLYTGTIVPDQLTYNLGIGTPLARRFPVNFSAMFEPVRWTPVLGLILLGAVLVTLRAIRGPRRGRQELLAGAVLVLGWFAVTLVLPALRIILFHVHFGHAIAYWSAAATWPWLSLALLPWTWRWILSANGTAPRRLLVTAGVYTIAVLLTSPVPGGFQWGPRFLLPATPLFAIALTLAAWRGRETLGQGERRMAGALVAGVVAVAMIVQLFGLAFLAKSRHDIAITVHRLRSLTDPGEVIVTDIFWVPQIAATLYPERRFLYVKESTDLPRLAARLRTHRIDTFATTGATQGNWLRRGTPRCLLEEGYRPGTPVFIPERSLLVRRWIHQDSQPSPQTPTALLTSPQQPIIVTP